MGTEMQTIRTHMNTNLRRRALLLAVLEFIVGGIVLLGCSGLVYLSIDASSKTLGSVHVFLGLMAFPAGYLLLMGKARARVLTLGVDVAIIAFSTVSEVILSTTGSLASGPFTDSIIGTTVAVFLSVAIPDGGMGGRAQTPAGGAGSVCWKKQKSTGPITGRGVHYGLSSPL